MDGEIRRIEAEFNYLQHADGSWSLVGRDGWPIDMETYADQAAELEADIEALEGFAALAAPVIDVEPVSVRDIPVRKELPRR